MDSFGNYPRERPFDPFSVMLFKALQVVAFLFFIALLAMNPEAKQGKIDTKAEFIITMSWPDSHPDDIDLYAEDPLGNIVWYHEREAGFMVLDRDDRGGAQQHHHGERPQDAEPDPPGDGQHSRHRGRRIHRQRQLLSRHPGAPRCRSRSRSRRSIPMVEVIHYDTIILDHMGQEKTAVRFRIADNGNVIDVNHRDKSLIQLTRSVRRPSAK